MQYNDIIKALASKQNGSYIAADVRSDVTLSAAAKRDGHTAYKVSHVVFRKGVSYANLASTKERLAKIDNAQEYSKLFELPWGEWVIPNLMLSHTPKKTGVKTYYLRVYAAPNKVNTTYFLDGKPMSRNDILTSGLVIDSYWKKQTPSEVRDYKIENIIKIY